MQQNINISPRQYCLCEIALLFLLVVLKICLHEKKKFLVSILKPSCKIHSQTNFQTEQQMAEKDERLAENYERLAEKEEELSAKTQQLQWQDEQIRSLMEEVQRLRADRHNRMNPAPDQEGESCAYILSFSFMLLLFMFDSVLI